MLQLCSTGPETREELFSFITCHMSVFVLFCFVESDSMYQDVPLYVYVRSTWMCVLARGGAHPGGCVGVPGVTVRERRRKFVGVSVWH